MIYADAQVLIRLLEGVPAVRAPIEARLQPRPASVAETTVRAGLLCAAGRATATGAFSPRAVALSKGVLQTMAWAKVKTLAAVLVAVGLLGTGAGWLSVRSRAAVPAPGGDAAVVQPEPKPRAPAEAPKKPRERPWPPPGGDAPVTRARLTRACLLWGNHVWLFKGQQFLLVGDKEGIPAPLLRALLGPDRKASRIRGAWDLDTTKGQLVLTNLVADGKPGPKEVRLGISPAGMVRVNLEKAGQYNLISFEEKLHVPGPGEFAPIYDYAQRIDHEFLQGTWDLGSRTADGKVVASNHVRSDWMVVKGDTLTLVSRGTTSRGTLRLDAVPTPGTLDVTFTEGPEKGNRYVGIYELKGDTLKLCRVPAGKGRPTAFTSRPGSGHVLDAFRRRAEGTAGR